MVIMSTMLLFTMLQSTRIRHLDMPNLHMELPWRKSLGFIQLTIQLFQSLFTNQTTIHQSQLITLLSQLIMLLSRLIMLQSQLIMLQSQSTMCPSLDITQSQSMGMVA